MSDVMGITDNEKDAASKWRERLLTSAQQDVHRLLEHATELGLSLEAETLGSAVVITRIACADMSHEQEQKLWEIRATLCEKVRPAQASGLRLMELLESENAKNEPRTLSGWSGRWLFAAVLLVAIAHVYAMVGSRLMEPAQQDLLQSASLIPRLAKTPERSAPQAIDAAPRQSEPATQALPERDLLEIADEQIQRLNMHETKLGGWNTPWRILLFPVAAPLAHASRDVPADMVWTLADNPTSAEGNTRLRQARVIAQAAITSLDFERQAAKDAHLVLTNYVLPMLYGALGAFVFVVRLVTSDLDRGSLRLLLKIRYRARLLLGAVFGLAVAMLTTESEKFPESMQFMTSIPLSAVPLSFLAGYGVDAVFGLLDGFILRAREAALAPSK